MTVAELALLDGLRARGYNVGEDVAALPRERCALCGQDRPAREFLPGLSKDYGSEEPRCGLCRAKSIIELSRHFGQGVMNGIHGTLRAATNVPVDAKGISTVYWEREFYGLNAGWLHVLEMDSCQMPQKARRAFVVAHLHEARVDAGHDVLLWRVRR